MAHHYNPTRPLNPPVGGWPVFDELSGTHVETIANSLNAVYVQAECLPVEERFEMFFAGIARTAKLFRTYGIVELSAGSLEDPLSLFCMDFASLLLVIEEPSMKKLRRKLEGPNWALPGGLNYNDTRSKPLIAFHKLLSLIKATVNELARPKWKRGRKNLIVLATVH